MAEDGTCRVKFAGTYDYDSAYEVFDRLNGYRQANGLSPLVMNRDVFAIAMQRAAECAIYFSHTRPNGRACDSINPFLISGENIASGQESGAEVMEDWKNSPGHNANMLTASYRAVGIGAFVASAVERTYGDPAFTNAAVNHTAGGGAVTYAGSNPSVASADAVSGKVTILGAGTAVITATAAEVVGAVQNGLMNGVGNSRRRHDPGDDHDDSGTPGRPRHRRQQSLVPGGHGVGQTGGRIRRNRPGSGHHP